MSEPEPPAVFARAGLATAQTSPVPGEAEPDTEEDED